MELQQALSRFEESVALRIYGLYKSLNFNILAAVGVCFIIFLIKNKSII